MLIPIFSRSFFLLTGNSSAKPSTPSNNFLRTLDDIEKSVYDAQAMKRYYSPSSLRLEKIKEYIKLAAKNGNNKFIQQALGHGLYTAIEIEKRKTRREKRCAVCSAVKKYMDTIKKEVGPAVFEKMIGVKEKVTLMFAIDTTASMSDEIATAKAIAKGIVDHLRQQTEVDYILSPFNDPGMYYGFLHWQNLY